MTIAATVAKISSSTVPLLASSEPTRRPGGTATISGFAIERSASRPPTGTWADAATVVWVPCARVIR